MHSQIARITAVLGGLGVVGLLSAGAASAATAGSPPAGANVNASVVVSTPTIALAMSTTQLTLTAQPGQTADSGPNAVQYTVAASSQGYHVVIAAPDLTSGANILAANDLTDHYTVSPAPGGQSGSGAAVLSNAGTTVYSSTTASHDGSGAAESVSEEWTAPLPGNLAAGNYATTISYTAVSG